MKVSKSKTIPWYFQLIVVLYTMHTTVPVLGFYTPAIVHSAVLAFLFFFLLFNNGKRTFSDIVRILPIFSIYLLSLLYSGFSHLATSIYGLLQLMIFPMISLFLIRTSDQIATRRIVIAVGISFIITALTTYLGCLQFPGASRDLAAMLSSRDSGLYAFYMSRNIGSFSFIYSLVLLIPVLVYLIKVKKINRLIGFTILTVFSLAIIESDYTTAFLCLLITLVVLFLSPKYIRPKYLTFLAFVSIILIIVGSTFIPTLLSRLGESVNSEVMSERLQLLSAYFENEEGAEGDVVNRVEAYSMSITAFLHSPVYGSPSAKIGGHSYVFDNMGSYGLLGILGMALVFISVFRLFYAPFKRQDWYGYILFSFCMSLFLSILNPKDNLTVLSYYLPLFCVAFNETKVI